jgi:hypothetical protein
MSFQTQPACRCFGNVSVNHVQLFVDAAGRTPNCRKAIGSAFSYYTKSRAGFVDKMRATFTEVYNERVRVLTYAVTLTETLITRQRQRT